jgi:hypothetical protein
MTLRREFDLPAQDVEFLDALDLPWETIMDGKVGVVIIHDFTLPEGFEPRSVSVAFRIEPAYPTTQIDMAYFHPAIRRTNRRNIPNVSESNFDGKVWQGWSRHRTTHQWRPDVDYVGTHYQYVKSWFPCELRRRP